MKPADAEAWERHMRLERELLAQRRGGKLAKAIGKALPGEKPQERSLKSWSRWPERTSAGPRRGS